MSKSLTLSMSLALALGFSGVSLAGHGDCVNCGISSPQGLVSPQASPQGVYGCDTCAPAKKHWNFHLSMPDCFKPKPKVYTYEWVLKKKRVWCPKEPVCDTCGPVYPTSQHHASPQGTWAAPQAYGAPQAGTMMAPAEMKPAAAAPAGDAVPAVPAAPVPAAPAPATPPAPAGAQSSLLFLAPAGN